MCGLMGNADVMRYFDVCRPLSPHEVRDQLNRWIAQLDSRGFAPGLIRCRCTGQTVGHGGLAVYPETEDQGPELIYLLDAPFWGRGLGTEFARAALDFGFSDLGVPLILSTVRPENKASVRVLDKVGMRRLKYWSEYHRYLYAISLDEHSEIPTSP